MPYFMPEPDKILPDRQSLLEALYHPEEWYLRHSDGINGHGTKDYKSLYLIQIIDSIVSEGKFPYNADVRVRAHELLGIESITYTEASREANPLSWLIYMAQCYRHSDMLRADGFELFTEEVLRRAYDSNCKIMINGKKCTPKKVGEKLYAFPPYSRKKVYLPDYMGPVKIVEE